MLHETVLQEAFRAKLVLGPKQLFAAVMEMRSKNPGLISASESILSDPIRGAAPSSLYFKFETISPGAVKQYIPNAAGESYVISELMGDARKAIGLSL